MKIIDLRSDTVTKPTEAMRAAMRDAIVGDDVFGDDPTINRLQALSAEILGKEAALFVPTGTFGNQLSVFTHSERGSEVIVGENSHIFNNETGGLSVLASVQARTINENKGYLNPLEVAAKIRPVSANSPQTSLICVENAHGSGQVMKAENMKEIYELAGSHGIPVHCDGARIFNAATYLGVDVKELSKYCDSISVCLSKGLCAPIGTMIAGSKEFILKATRKRRVMGGGMRQVGVLGAPGIIAITEMTKRLHEDHTNAKELAVGLSEFTEITLNPDDIEINMIFFGFSSSKMTADEFIEKLKENGVLCTNKGGEIRMLTHNDISSDDIAITIGVVEKILA